MPIIFGWGRQSIKSIGVVFKNLCTHCHNEEYWIMTRIVTWFTLFFIPLIPYETKYFLSCPVCKYGLTLEEKQIMELKPIAELNQLLVDGKITKEEYGIQIKQVNGNPTDSIEAEVVETKALTKNPSNLIFCTGCGQKTTEDSQFCGNCGIKAATK